LKHKPLNRQNEIPEEGLPKDAVLHELETKLQGDLTYSCGKILGSMCTQPSSFAKQVYLKYLETNLGDPGLFPATAQLEKEVIDMLGNMLSIDSACGHIVSGGTEANLLAMWAARNLAKKKRGEVVVPVSAHYSFDKAADLLNLKLIKVKLNSNYQMDINAVKEAITPNTVALVGIAGTTGLGVVDPIPELSELAIDNDIFLHVDAAFGNLMDHLKTDGTLENSYIVMTSDHGEIFERGFYGHGGVFMYEPAIKIPLLISAPGQTKSNNVHLPTSNIDLLPTLLHIAEKDIPDILDGQVLPEFGGNENNDRAIYSMYAAENSVFMPLRKTAISMHKGSFKLIAYFGYPGFDDVYELYDLESDPEELHDLTKDEPAIFTLLKDELLNALADANRPYDGN